MNTASMHAAASLNVLTWFSYNPNLAYITYKVPPTSLAILCGRSTHCDFMRLKKERKKRDVRGFADKTAKDQSPF